MDGPVDLRFLEQSWLIKSEFRDRHTKVNCLEAYFVKFDCRTWNGGTEVRDDSDLGEVYLFGEDEGKIELEEFGKDIEMWIFILEDRCSHHIEIWVTNLVFIY